MGTESESSMHELWKLQKWFSPMKRTLQYDTFLRGISRTKQRQDFHQAQGLKTRSSKQKTKGLDHGIKNSSSTRKNTKAKIQTKEKDEVFFSFFLWSDKESNEQSIGLTNEEKLN